MMLTVILACLLALTTVSAAENDTIADLQASDAVSGLENNLVDDSLSANPDASFTDLANEIANSGEQLNLTRNYVYDSNKDSNYAGGIEINKKITIDGGGFRIDGNNNVRAFNITSADVVLTNINFVKCSIISNSTGDYDYACGGAVYCSNVGATLSDCSFVNCSAASISKSQYSNVYGGAVYGASCVGCSFINCSVTPSSASWSSYAYGGAVYGGSCVNCSFLNNFAKHSGGAIYECCAADCRFIGNSASYGGAMWNGTAINCSFINNSASCDGGAMSDASAINCTFTSNSADYEGGSGGAMKDSSAVECTFIGNSARYGGAMDGCSAINSSFINNSAFDGGVMSDGSCVNCTFKSNSATRYGGVMSGGSCEDCSFINNSARYGGAMWWVDNAVNCRFINNSAVYGGAVYFDDYTVMNISQSEFMLNHAEKGGAVYCVYPINVTSSRFMQNHAEKGGALYCEEDAVITVSESEFMLNHAGYGGAIYHESFTNPITVELTKDRCVLKVTVNSEFSDNVADYGGAICIATTDVVEENIDVGQLSLTENITFKNNTAHVNGSALYLSYSDFFIDEGVRFIDNPGVVVFIDNLIVSGDCYNEYSVANTYFSNSSESNFGGAISIRNGVIYVKFDSSYTGKGKVSINSKDVFESTFTNGMMQFNLSEVNIQDAIRSISIANPADGYNTWVDLPITSESGFSISDPDASIYHGSTFSYIQTLIDGIVEDGIIELSGNYTGAGSEIIITKTLTINGNGAVLDAKGLSRALSIGADNVVLNNINFVNCRDSSKYGACGGAIYWNGANASLVNCTFVNCSAATSGSDYCARGGALYLNASHAYVEGCDFVNCSAINDYSNVYYHARDVSSYGGALYLDCGAHHAFLLNCTFRNSRAGTHAYSEDTKGLSSDTSTYSYGGAIYWKADYGSLINADFMISIADASSFSGYSSSHSYSAAYSCGGALYWMGDNGIIVRCTFENSTAKARAVAGRGTDSIGSSTYGCGGAVYLEGSFKNVSACRFVDSYADVKSGCADIVEGGVDWDVSGTSSSYSVHVLGNAVYVDSGSFDNCTFMNNKTDTVQNDIFGNATTRDCVFDNYDLAVGDVGKYYGDDKKLVATLLGGGSIPIANAYVNVTVGDKKMTVKTDSNGRASIPLDLPVGNYDANVAYGLLSTTSKVTVKSTIAASDASGNYLNSKVSATFLDITGNVLSGMKVTFKVGEQTYTATTNANGAASADVDLCAGNYTVTAVNPLNNEQKQFKLSIAKANSAIALTYSQNNGVITLTATLTPSSATGNVIFNIRGQDNSPAIKSGKAVLTLSGLNPGNYTVAASYAGDANLKASASNVLNFTVDDTYPVLTAKAVTKVYGTSTNLVVYLKDNKGNAIWDAYVSVVLNKFTKKIKTDSMGRATMPIGVAPGTYSAKISYLTAQTTAKITVKKATPKMAASKKTFKASVKTKKYTITLKTNMNKVMKNKKVTLKVNGKTYKATTNSKGKATFKITKLAKKGKFTAVVKFAGSKYYNAKAVKAKITVK